MLVITRKEGESVVLTLGDGTEVRVMISQVKKNGVRIGFIAPTNILVHRYDEEQKIENELLQFKKIKKINCSDKDFIGFWMDTLIPQFGKSAREIVRQEPTRMSEVMLLLKKEFM
jgi:carbon storage regulator CsrA